MEEKADYSEMSETTEESTSEMSEISEMNKSEISETSEMNTSEMSEATEMSEANQNAFDIHKPIASVIDININCHINTDVFFVLCPLYHGPYVDTLRKKNIQSAPPRGSILSLKYKGYIRGRPNNPRCMKNNIILRISMGDRVVTANIGGNTIHICGTKSKAAAIEIAEVIIESINNTVSISRAINKDYDLWHNWLTKQISDMNEIIYSDMDIKYENGKIFWPETIPWLNDKEKNKWLNEANGMSQMNKVTKNNILYANYIINFTNEVIPENMFSFMEYINEDIIQNFANPVSIIGAKFCMIRYRYNIGYMINKIDLFTKINELYNNNEIVWASVYDASTTDYVQLLLPQIYTSTVNKSIDKSITKTKGKAKEKPKMNTFQIHHSGRVDQYSPSDDDARVAYGKFIELLEEYGGEFALY